MSSGADPTPPWRRARLWVTVAAGVVLLTAGWFVLHLLTAGPPTLAELESRAGCTNIREADTGQSPTKLGSCTVAGSTVLLGTFASNEDRDSWVNELRALGPYTAATSRCVAHGDRWAAVALRQSACPVLGTNLKVETTAFE